VVLTDYVFPQFGGLHWFAYLRERCRPIPRQKGLSLCCGDGLVERWLLQSGICAACEGIDISPDAIAVAQREAASAGIGTLTYRVADVERLRLQPNFYDLAVGWMGLHHIDKLSRLLIEVKRALRPGGVLVVNEYVGPSRFQMPSEQVGLINEWLTKLPERLRVTVAGDVRQSFRPPSVAEVIARDPSEALHPDQILPLVRHHFTIVEQTNYGGGLLFWLLCEILQNFDPDSGEDRGWLERFYTAERDAMARGELQSDFAFVVARKPEQPDGATREARRRSREADRAPLHRRDLAGTAAQHRAGSGAVGSPFQDGRIR
jgi:ubiquinone/menaquinone biosynthesis C-methylase UbiE